MTKNALGFTEAGGSNQGYNSAMGCRLLWSTGPTRRPKWGITPYQDQLGVSPRLLRGGQWLIPEPHHTVLLNLCMFHKGQLCQANTSQVCLQ